MASVKEQLRQARIAENKPKNVAGNGRKKNISGHGTGKWQTQETLAAYREQRNKARKLAKRARRAA